MKKVAKKDGKYYVVDAQGNELAGPFDTFGQANAAASGSGPVSATGATPAGSTSTKPAVTYPPGVAQPNVGDVAGMGAAGQQTEPVNAQKAAGIETNLTNAEVVKAVKEKQITAGQGYEYLRSNGLSDEEATIYLNNRGVNYSERQVTGNGPRVGGTGGGKGSSVPPEYQSLVDSFAGLSDKDVIKAFYDGEITREQLGVLLLDRNEKLTTASMERYLKQIEADKPQPKRTALDYFDANRDQLSDLRARIESGDFGVGTQKVGSLGAELPGIGVNPETGQREGLSFGYKSPLGPGLDAGVPQLAGVTVGGQNFRSGDTSSGLTGAEGKPFYWQGHAADILNQRGFTGTGNAVDDLETLGLSNDLYNSLSGAFGLSTADAAAEAKRLLKSGKAGGSYTKLLNQLEAEPSEIDYYARGGVRLMQDPYAGVNLNTGKVDFMAGENGPEMAKFTPVGGGASFDPEMPTSSLAEPSKKRDWQNTNMPSRASAKMLMERDEIRQRSEMVRRYQEAKKRSRTPNYFPSFADWSGQAAAAQEAESAPGVQNILDMLAAAGLGGGRQPQGGVRLMTR